MSFGNPHLSNLANHMLTHVTILAHTSALESDTSSSSTFHLSPPLMLTCISSHNHHESNLLTLPLPKQESNSSSHGSLMHLNGPEMRFNTFEPPWIYISFETCTCIKIHYERPPSSLQLLH